jgi:hypothetical protein
MMCGQVGGVLEGGIGVSQCGERMQASLGLAAQARSHTSCLQAEGPMRKGGVHAWQALR